MTKHDRKGKRVSIGACNSKRRAMQGTTRNRFVGSVSVIVMVDRGIYMFIDALSKRIIWLPRITRCAMQRMTRHLSRVERPVDLIRMKNPSVDLKRSRKMILSVGWIITDWANVTYTFRRRSATRCVARIGLIHTLMAFLNGSRPRSEQET